MGSTIYLAFSALVPVDEAARGVYTSLGCVTSWLALVGWQQRRRLLY